MGFGECPSLLFIRECYNNLFPMVESMLNDVNKLSKVVLVMGTPGMGKTVFGLYAAFKLLGKGETVMYFHGGVGVYFPPGPSGQPGPQGGSRKGFRRSTSRRRRRIHRAHCAHDGAGPQEDLGPLP